MKKRSKFLLLLLLMLSALTGFDVPSVQAASSITIPAKAALAVDAGSGKILYTQDANEPMGIASITKILTVYVAYEQIAKGKLKLDTRCAVSNYALGISQDTEASGFPLAAGEDFTVQDLIDACLIPSANSAAVILAEKIAGTEPKFVDMMKAQLKSWGITDEKLVNATGLNNSMLPQANWYPHSTQNDENELSATDVAIVAMHLINDFPQVLDITKANSMVFDANGRSQTTMNTTNYMLPGFQTSRPGVDGLKTGSTTFAGDCFVGTAVQSNMRIITVVLNADNPNGDTYARFNATNSLMTYCFGNWQSLPIARSGDQIKGYEEAPVADGAKPTVPLVTKSTFAMVVKMGDPAYDISFKKAPKGGVEAAIKKGQTIASVKTVFKDSLGYLPGYSGSEMDLVASEAVPRASALIVGWNHFIRFINEQL